LRTVTISNSEVDEWLRCRRRHFYKYTLGIEPKRKSLALNRGITGHKAIQRYYEAKIDGQDCKTCKKIALEEINDTLLKSLEDDELTGVLLHLKRLVGSYINFYWDEPFQPIAIEQKYFQNLSEDIRYGMQCDIIMKGLRGGHKGNFIPMDHKFTYDFWNSLALKTNVQIPKYINTIRANGIVCSKGVINQIRYRPLKSPTDEDLFRRDWINISPELQENIMNEQLQASRIIADTKALPVAVQNAHAIRTMNKKNCDYCPFFDPCYQELLGRDVSRVLSLEYQPTTYGYDGDEV
jgi:hypothetical protein